MRISYPWTKNLARTGYASRGVVYLIVGVFAMLAAFGGAEKTDSEGALLKLLGQPFGQAMVLIMILGLISYVVWRLVQTIFDTDDHGWSLKGIAVRGGLLASAFTYAVLALYALALVGAAKSSDSGGTSIADTIAGTIGSKPLQLTLCVVFAGAAIAHWFKALTRGYAAHFQASESAMRLVHPVSMAGLIARGTVFAVTALLLAFRFLDGGSRDGDPPGLADVLAYIHQLPMGRWLLALMGLGLLLFAGYSFLEALWRRINLEDAT